MTELCHGGSLSLSMPWKNYNAAALAKLLARSSVPITQERDIFNWHGSFSVSIPVFQSDGRKFHIFWHVTERSPSYGNAKKKRVEQRLAEMNWPDRWNCTMPSSLLVHYFWWTKAIGQRQDILIKRRPTLAYWGKISAEWTWPRTRALDRYPAHLPSRVNTLTNEISHMYILTPYYYLNFTYPSYNTTR